MKLSETNVLRLLFSELVKDGNCYYLWCFVMLGRCLNQVLNVVLSSVYVRITIKPRGCEDFFTSDKDV